MQQKPLNVWVRLRLFHLKMVLGNYFTPLWVFGTYGKYGQTENTVHVDRKIRPFGCKIVYTLILPSMNSRKTHSKRKSERELKHTPPKVIPKHILAG